MAKKLILDIGDELWIDVQKFKLEKKLQNNNEAVVELIKRALAKINNH